MSDISSVDTTTLYRRPPPRIALADDVLVPRREFARNELGVSDKTASRMNLPTTYVGNRAYVARDASLKIVADSVRRRRNNPTTPRRK
jgi:hypothetical protein